MGRAPGDARGGGAPAPRARPARSGRPARESLGPPRAAPLAPTRRATPGGSPSPAPARGPRAPPPPAPPPRARALASRALPGCRRSEEHTSELQSLAYLVCRLLLEKKKKINKVHDTHLYLRQLTTRHERCTPS